jgi:hypothetical protein
MSADTCSSSLEFFRLQSFARLLQLPAAQFVRIPNTYFGAIEPRKPAIAGHSYCVDQICMAFQHTRWFVALEVPDSQRLVFGARTVVAG